MSLYASIEAITEIMDQRFRDAAKALRVLYYITGDKKYAKRASKVFEEGQEFIKKYEEEHYDEDLPF